MTSRRYKGVAMRRGTRLAIYLRDSFRCVYCCADLHGADPRDVTLDHVIPASDSGSNAPSNLVTACRRCNCSRQDTPLRVYAGPETRADIRRLTRRSLAPYRRLAAAILDGSLGQADALTRGGLRGRPAARSRGEKQ